MTTKYLDIECGFNPRNPCACDELVCIGELMWDGVSGVNLRMELSEKGGKQWYEYRVVDEYKNILEQFAEEMGIK